VNESQVFADALKLASPAERAAFLDEVCAGNPHLRADVEALLVAHATDPGFLERPAGSLAGTAEGRDPPPPEPQEPHQPGDVLAGRYKLVEEIGEGGMGTVWMAQQTEPVKRLVAVKLIKAAWIPNRSSPGSRRSGRRWR
jgi:eukaryotic-like serine/threonine-protein kinase